MEIVRGLDEARLDRHTDRRSACRRGRRGRLPRKRLVGAVAPRRSVSTGSSAATRTSRLRCSLKLVTRPPLSRFRHGLVAACRCIPGPLLRALHALHGLVACRRIPGLVACRCTPGLAACRRRTQRLAACSRCTRRLAAACSRCTRRLAACNRCTRRLVSCSSTPRLVACILRPLPRVLPASLRVPATEPSPWSLSSPWPTRTG